MDEVILFDRYFSLLRHWRNPPIFLLSEHGRDEMDSMTQVQRELRNWMIKAIKDGRVPSQEGRRRWRKVLETLRDGRRAIEEARKHGA